MMADVLQSVDKIRDIRSGKFDTPVRYQHVVRDAAWATPVCPTKRVVKPIRRDRVTGRSSPGDQVPGMKLPFVMTAVRAWAKPNRTSSV